MLTGIDVSMLKGKKLLNMDSEEEGVMLASCAGGCRADVKLPVGRETVSGTKAYCELIRSHRRTLRLRD